MLRETLLCVRTHSCLGVVTSPKLLNMPPVTVRLGDPQPSLVEKILDPMLHERVAVVGPHCAVWKPVSVTGLTAAMVSLDFERDAEAADAAKVLEPHTSTCVFFPHPLRAGCTRLLSVLPLPVHSTDQTALLQPLLAALALLRPTRGEVHCSLRDVTGDDTLASASSSIVVAALAAAGLSSVVSVNAGASSGFVLHSKACELQKRCIGSGADTAV